MSQGKIVQIIGAVVDVEFPRDAIPRVYDALKLDANGLTLEVQQLLGDGVVRTIAMGSSDGLKRGMTVSNTGAPITVPVGKGTLGRIVDVLGTPESKPPPIAAPTPGINLPKLIRPLLPNLVNSLNPTFLLIAISTFPGIFCTNFVAITLPIVTPTFLNN